MPKIDTTKPRKKPRQARSRVTVDAIVTAATRILVDAGYDRANVNDIARRAGVSVGSLYQYFPTKDALMSAVVQRHSEAMMAVFEDGLADVAEMPIRQAIRECVRRGLAAFALDPKLRRIVVELPRLAQATSTPDWDATIELTFREYMKFHRERFRPRDLECAAKIVKVGVEAIAHHYAVVDPVKLRSPELLEEIVDMVCRYLLVDEDPRRID